MKKTLYFTLSVVAALSIVSCKNYKNQEPTQEEIQAQKQALADSVLAGIDKITAKYIAYNEGSFEILNFKLDEAEKMVKPNYLLDPSEANLFITRKQKVNALAIYFIEMTLRQIYDMPVDEVKEAITKLAVEINYPIGLEDQYLKDMAISERIRAEYDKCRKNGDLALFWQFHNALITEIHYIFTQNPELFLSKISEDQLSYFINMCHEDIEAIRLLAEYDEEMADVNNMTTEFLNSIHKPSVNDIKTAKQYFIDNKDAFAAFRKSLLQ